MVLVVERWRHPVSGMDGSGDGPASRQRGLRIPGGLPLQRPQRRVGRARALTRGGPDRRRRGAAKPDALAAGIVGTLVGDIVASSSGLRIPSHSRDEDGYEPAGRERWDWRDRAGLMEAAWEAKAESLTARFDQRLSGPVGVLVLNSTAAGRGCPGSRSAKSSRNRSPTDHGNGRRHPGDREPRFRELPGGRPASPRHRWTCRRSTGTVCPTCHGRPPRCCPRASRRSRLGRGSPPWPAFFLQRTAAPPSRSAAASDPACS